MAEDKTLVELVKHFEVHPTRLAVWKMRVGIEVIYRKPGTRKKDPGHQVYPYLLRNRDIRHANQVLALDTLNRAVSFGNGAW